MPDLPTLTVTDVQATRLLAAFAGQTDDQGVALTPVQAYRRWLRTTLREHVIRTETRALDEQANATKRDAIASAEAALP